MESITTYRRAMHLMVDAIANISDDPEACHLALRRLSHSFPWDVEEREILILASISQAKSSARDRRGIGQEDWDGLVRIWQDFGRVLCVDANHPDSG